MSWRAYLGDTMTGLIDRPVDLPCFSWAVTVSDSSLATSRDKGAGTEDWSGVTVPWSAVGGGTAAERASALSPSRRFLALLWEGEGGAVAPVLWGAIGQRTDTWLDTSFSLDSAMTLLSRRLVVAEGAYGTGPGGTSPASLRLEGLSYRGIVSEIVRVATSKPAGALPIDLPYLGEAGTRAREYAAFDVQNNSADRLIENVCDLIGGPDVQFRPYMADASHVRLRLLAGSDADRYLGQGEVHTLTCFPGGGTIQGLTVDHAGPVMRVYASGSGTDAAQICHLSEDLSLCELMDPWPLVEEAYSDADTDSPDVLARHADATLAGNCRPLMQLSGEVDFADPGVLAPGSMWPGERVDIAVAGFPTLPDGVYRCRLMEMSGDQSTRARLTFDVMDDPIY